MIELEGIGVNYMLFSQTWAILYQINHVVEHIRSKTEDLDEVFLMK